MVKVSEIKKTKWYLWLGNKYVIFILLFLTWMFFFDANNYFFHKELSDDIKALEESKDAAELPDVSGEVIAKEFERYLRRQSEN